MTPSKDWGKKKSILSIKVKAKQMTIPTMNAMIWFRVNDEANNPTAVKAAPGKTAPK